MDNQHYRYCFSCDKWLNKQEVNKIEWGEQPGGGSGECWHCSYCRKQLGDDSQTQIFRCKQHHDEILKVWGVLDGKNKEKIFFKACPQEIQEQSPSKPPLLKIGMSILAVIVAIGGLFSIMLWKRDKKEK